MTNNQTSHISLLELGSLIKDVVQSNISDAYWVTAEIASCKQQNSSGHSYIELVEKQGETVIAKMSATIWKYNSKLLVKFQEATGKPLEAGMKVLSLVRVSFHTVYGISLNIQDIDPAYTLGEMAIARKLIIERLTKEGIINKNKELSLPLVIQKIAIITSATAAGKDDFVANIREKNKRYGYHFSLILKESLMQGAKVEETMLKALRECKDIANRLDVVVIVRGGGSVADLHCFDNYNIAKEIALFPIPVLSGIGHEGCSYFVMPKTRTEWWNNKIKRNKKLDRKHTRSLKKLGWKIVIVYECKLKPQKRVNTLQNIVTELAR